MNTSHLGPKPTVLTTVLYLTAIVGGLKEREGKQELKFIKYLLRHYLVEFSLQPDEVALIFSVLRKLRKWTLR